MNFDRQDKLETTKLYIQKMRPLLNRRALFSDTTAEYVMPAEPAVGEKIIIDYDEEKQDMVVNVIPAAERILTE